MKLINTVNRYALKASSLVPDWFVLLTLRLGIFLVFWRSVQTKITGGEIFGQNLFFWNITDSTFMLFEYEYALPLIPYKLAAYLATFGEFFLALGILFGFFTRLSALGLLMITLVIQIFVYPEPWPEHLLWAAILFTVLKFGAGSLSIDTLLKK